jgi:hypothetical protein
MSAPAADMARFMLAHLQWGELDGARILQEETARTMHEQSFTHDPRVAGFAHGFIEGHHNGRRAIGHGGSTVYFQSQLTLLPEENTGLFVSFNSTAAISTPDQVVAAFVDRYFPGAQEAPPQADGGDLSAFAGSYAPTRGNVSSPEKLLTLFNLLNIAPQADGSAAVTLAGPPLALRAVQVAPGVLREVSVPESGYGDVVLLPGQDGAPPTALIENFPIQAFVKAPGYATLQFALPLAGVLLLLCLSVVVGGPVVWWISRHYHERRPRRVRVAGWVLFALAVTVIVYLVGMVVAFSDPDLVFGTPPWLNLVFMLVFAIAALTVAALVFAVLAWLRRDWGWLRRLHYSAVALVAALFVWWLWYWKMFALF